MRWLAAPAVGRSCVPAGFEFQKMPSSEFVPGSIFGTWVVLFEKKRQTHPLVSYLLLGRCSGNFSRLLEGGGAEEEQKHGRASGGLRLAVRPAGQACPVEKVTFVPGREGDGGVLQAGVGGQQDRQRVSVRGRVARAEGVEGWQRFSG